MTLDLSRRPMPSVRPTTTVRVVRPDDLLVFQASWTGLTLGETATAPPERGFNGLPVARPEPPRLVAGDRGGLLTIHFDSQHVAEFASVNGDAPTVGAPVPARAANPSRLVFEVPAGAAIDFTIEGLLHAIGHLELAVVAAATAAPEVRRPRLDLAPIDGLLLRGLLNASSGARLSLAALGPAPLGGPALIETQQAMMAANRVLAAGGSSGIGIDADPGRTVATDQGLRGPVVAGPLDPAGQRETPPAPVLPTRPTAGETAIEAPFRLILSPSRRGGWAHALNPVAAPGDPRRVELWHSRLAVRNDDGSVDEVSDDQRIVRAIWTRDRDMAAPTDPLGAEALPRRADRDLLVSQTAGSPGVAAIARVPARVRRLALSSLGTWLDLHAHFLDASFYPNLSSPLFSWDQVSPMGRDQHVRLARQGYLWPLGHKAFLIEIMYRKVVGTAGPQTAGPRAALFTRRFITLGDPVRSFAHIDFPFVSARVGPLRTPDLQNASTSEPFWPQAVGESKLLAWTVHGFDHDGQVIHLTAPLMFVPANMPPDKLKAKVPGFSPPMELVSDNLVDVAAAGQSIAFAPALALDQQPSGGPPSDARAEATTVTWWAEPGSTTCEPFMQRADVVVPALRRLSETADSVRVKYHPAYIQHGFDSANVGNVYLQLAEPTNLSFGTSEHSGGFIKPDLAVGGLARSTGLVSNADDAAIGTFKSAALFPSDLLPKLFGLFNLADLIADGPLALAPKFVTEELNLVSGMIRDFGHLKAALADAEERGSDLDPGKTIANAVDQFDAALKPLLEASSADDAVAAIAGALGTIGAAIPALRGTIAKAPLGPFDRAQLDRLLMALQPVQDIAGHVEETAALIEKVRLFLGGLNPGGGEFRARMEWRPALKQDITIPPLSGTVLHFDVANALRLVVEARVTPGHGVGLDVSAELSSFQLTLLPGAPLMALRFERLSFRGGSSRKPEVDIVFGGIAFLGVLSFINVLEKLIPTDGFSDPPFLDCSAEGVTAGFTVGLPNVAVGAFSLTNISLAADARVPFLGESISVGFGFCTRERPFTLGVFPLGGGGFVGLRATPGGLSLLEMSLEFGALVALDFGVASGSVSAMGGIYLRLEDQAGSLTGFFRVRGEVDVLSLISASIELYMALTYVFDTGKMVGEASVTVHVAVLFFSTSVSIHTQRTFAGSNGDPTAAEMLQPVGDQDPWADYCDAFADEGA